MQGSRLDRIARDLAAGEISRRSALKRLTAAGVGLGAAMAPIAEALGGGCPGDRVVCDGKCCPKNARCRRGKCRCKPGFTKCGRKCVDAQTSVKHCGACDNPCPQDESCISGICSECVTAAGCPPDGQCGVAACQSGQCVYSPNPQLGQACDGDDGDTNPNGTFTCQQGQIVCTGDTTPPECDDPSDCGTATECRSYACQGGSCSEIHSQGGEACEEPGVPDGICDGQGNCIPRP